MKNDVIQLEESDGITHNIDFTTKDALKNYFIQSAASKSTIAGANGFESETLQLRNYQDELCRDALTGQNAIICAPTGSGKTIVAVKLIQEHLRKRLKSGLKAKVVLLVPTVNLIDQQTAVLDRYLSKQFRICAIKGGQQTASNKVPKCVMLHDNHISVMTPQLFLNMLLSVADEDISLPENDPTNRNMVTVELSDITMMVFDECHHADKSHAYNEIMNFYFDLKHDGLDGLLPQVVGLTASLGVGQADNAQKAVDHVIKICANLDVTKLSVIERYLDELEEHVYAPKDEIRSVRCSHYDHPLSVNIIAIMKLLEKAMDPIFEHLENAGVKTTKEVDRKPPEKRWASHYTSWVFSWHHYAPRIADSALKQKLLTLLKHAIIYHKSLEINALAPTAFAVKYMNEEFTILQRKKTTTLEKELLRIYESQEDKFNLIASSPEDRKPIVDSLKYLLLKEYNEKPDSRTLVFVRTRELALAVEKFINTDQSLYFLNAGHLTGVNARKDLGGQTEREQQDCLERFKSGHHKLLVATTVAEEGLDINKCNLVIKYNHVTNEIALVQRRGRGRAVGSKSILLTHEGWIEQKEMVNLMRERLMKTAIEIIKTKSEGWFIAQIDEKAKQTRQEKEIEKVIRDRERKKLGNKLYDLLCKKCDNLLTSSVNVRTILCCHYVSVDDKIWTRLCAEPKPQPLSFSDIAVAGVLSCAKCREDCGVVVKYRQVFFPALKAEAMVIRNPSTMEKKTAKKWKQIQSTFFVVDPIKNADLPPMFHALSLSDRDKLDRALERVQQNADRDQADKRAIEREFLENTQAALFFIEGDMDDTVVVAYDLVDVDV